MSSSVRYEPVAVPAWLKLGFNVVATAHPPWAALLARKLFFRTRRRRAKPSELEVLAQARRIRLETPRGPARLHRWGGEGPVVVWMHGWNGDSAQLSGWVKPLLDAGYQVVAVDAPGHGASEGRESSALHFAEALLAAQAEVGPFHAVIAHSLGAAGTSYALRRGLQTARAVFLAPPLTFDTFWSRFQGALGASERVSRSMLQRAEDWLDISFDDVIPARYAAELRTPLLVVHDRGDSEIPFSEGEALAGIWPGARLLPTEGLGHYRLLKDPAVQDAALEFLRTGADTTSVVRTSACPA